MPNPKVILIVDDEPDLIEIAQTHLESAGYGIITASNGKEGLEAAKRFKPDLILLDITMPEMDGLQMLEILRGTEGLKSMKVLMLTAKGQSSNIFEAEHLRVLDFLIKPFSCDELLEAVRKAV